MNIDLLLNRISELALKRGESLNTVFVNSGVGKNFKSNLKNANPSLGKITMLANYFGVTVDYLLGKEEQSARSADSVFSLSKEEQEILLTYRENEAFREAVMNIYRLTKPAEQTTVRVFRAARSDDNHGPEVVDMDAARLERLKNLPDTDDPL